MHWKKGQTVNKTYYLKVLATLRGQVFRKWAELWKNKSWILYHNNTSTHNALSIKRYLGTPVL